MNPKKPEQVILSATTFVELTNQVKELTAKLDICKRYATGEMYDEAMLANDYGGTGWELDERVQAVGQAIMSRDTTIAALRLRTMPTDS